MSDYPIENGVFLKALDKMPDRLKFPFISTEAEARYMVMISGGSSQAATAAPAPPKKNKIKYTCPSCQTNVWGKADFEFDLWGLWGKISNSELYFLLKNKG